MWIKVIDGSANRLGRVNLNQVSMLVPDGSGSTWKVRVHLVGPSGITQPTLPVTFATEAEATAAIDDLILNGN